MSSESEEMLELESNRSTASSCLQQADIKTFFDPPEGHGHAVPAGWEIRDNRRVDMSCRQRGSRVERISAVGETPSTSAVSLCHTTSITADPENAWIARRQSVITAALLERRGQGDAAMDDDEGRFPLARNGGQRDVDAETVRSQSDRFPTGQRLSGESDRLGTGNWDDPAASFGKHIGYL